jgi:hypothetical protein
MAVQCQVLFIDDLPFCNLTIVYPENRGEGEGFKCAGNIAGPVASCYNFIPVGL